MFEINRNVVNSSSSIFIKIFNFKKIIYFLKKIAQDSNQNNQKTEIFEREFIVCSLDLISGLAEGLATGFESLVSNSNLGSLLFECLKVIKNIYLFFF